METVTHASLPPVSGEDDQIKSLATAIKEASLEKNWDLVRELNATMREALRKRGPLSAEHASGISRSNAAFQATRALAEGDPTGPLLAAFASDPRFGSLRGYAEARGINRSSLNAYASGRYPCPPAVDKLVRRDFPHLKWEWPAGVSRRREPAIDRAVGRYIAGELDAKAAAKEAGVSVGRFMDVLDKRQLSR